VLRGVNLFIGVARPITKGPFRFHSFGRIAASARFVGYFFPGESRMNPQRKLSQLCRRHGLPESVGAPLLPLLQQAALARRDLQRSMVAVVDATLAREAERLAQERQTTANLDETCLRAMARVLHGWGSSDAKPQSDDAAT
jgi:hypothetical protein